MMLAGRTSFHSNHRFSIGGDADLKTVVTLPSKHLFAFDMAHTLFLKCLLIRRYFASIEQQIGRLFSWHR
jgi:hypothetical protein